MTANRRKTTGKRIYDSFGLVVLDSNVTVSTGVNHEIRDRRLRIEGTPIWSHGLILQLECLLVWSEERHGETISFWLSDRERRPNCFDETLQDRIKLDGFGRPLTKKVRGEERVVYDIPKGIGFIERTGRNKGGYPNWSAAAWVRPEVLRDMVWLTRGIPNVYLHVLGFKEGKVLWVTTLEMSLGDEDDRKLGPAVLEKFQAKLGGKE
jgi:hypothetical protein